MSDTYSEPDPDEPEEIGLGRRIYHEALGDRRGFRPDQIGIPYEDPVWVEIFDAIARAAIGEFQR